jgi:hypothetical protein
MHRLKRRQVIRGACGSSYRRRLRQHRCACNFSQHRRVHGIYRSLAAAGGPPDLNRING